jgi:phosphohistidine phosphatase
LNIYLVRHGSAENKTKLNKDSDRNLTDAGKDEIKRTALNLKQLVPNIDFIISSPFNRAVQSAEIIKREFDLNKELILDEKLSPGSGTESLIEIANKLDAEDIVFVGHEPDFSVHTSKLISNSGIKIYFRKGAVVSIYFEGKVRLASGILEFLIPPI